MLRADDEMSLLLLLSVSVRRDASTFASPHPLACMKNHHIHTYLAEQQIPALRGEV